MKPSTSYASRLFTLALAGTCYSAAVQSAQSTDIKALLADVTASNAGVELIVPYVDFSATDADGDGVPDKGTISFTVNKLADASGLGNAKLYGTSSKTFTNVSYPCDPASSFWIQINEESATLRDGKYALVALADSIQCADTVNGSNAAYKTTIFKADVSKSDGAAGLWSYDYNLVGISLVDDMNANGYKEVMIVMTKSNTGTSGEDYFVVIKDISSGQVISSGTYPFWVP